MIKLKSRNRFIQSYFEAGAVVGINVFRFRPEPIPIVSRHHFCDGLFSFQIKIISIESISIFVWKTSFQYFSKKLVRR